MSLYIDLKYINLISNNLSSFKRKNQNLFNFRCPLCGDSAKKNKARGYIYRIPNKNEMSMKCHNCGASMYFGSFLKQIDPLRYKEYALEKFKESKDAKPVREELDFKVDETKFADVSLLDKLFDRLDTLPPNNEAVTFCRKRKISDDNLKRLYFVDDVKKIEQLSDKYKNKIGTSEPRLVLPFYNHKGEFEGVSCRALRGESLRYLTVKIRDDADMIFGAELINTKRKVYAVEGPIDSLFLPNAVAVGSTAFAKISKLNVAKENFVIILDNQPRNKEVVKQYQKYIEDGYRICIWPQTIIEKDINDIVLSGKTAEQVKSIIDKNTFQGLEAQLKFISWKRV